MATVLCDHKHTCLTCILRWIESEGNPPNGCPYRRTKIAQLETLIPHPQFRIEESQTIWICQLARPFAETEMGCEEMGRGGKR